MSYQSKDAARRTRAEWMERFETECIRLCPKIRGRVDWNTATYYYLKGETPKGAADKWINNVVEVAE
jgi:hypothetical protein